MAVATMIRVSQSVHSGLTTRRRVEIRITRSGYLWACLPGHAREEKFKRDALGVWRRYKSAATRNTGNYRVWLEEEKDGN